MARARKTTYLIKMCEMVLRSAFEQRLQDVKVTGLQYGILSIVSEGPRFSAADLARSCHVTPQSMCESVSTLEQKGLVRREVDPSNRRILRISITADGSKMLARCEKEMKTVEKQIFSCLSKDELDQFRSALRRIVAQADAEINYIRPEVL